ncbi:MAG TPA: helix-turn-helix transcriptional regulator [Tepidisphaeraceae bacterium]|nr:helix-turn-helix transcriptional regulator [Tepidisphaeraceae bacterium]
MKIQTITRGGKRFALVSIAEYERLAGMPPFPKVDADGTSNAIEFARTAIARRLIQDRRAARLTQQQLAALAGVRQETISRLESGKHTASVRTIDRIDRAIRKARPGAARPSRKSA